MPGCAGGAVVIAGSPVYVQVTDAWMFSFFGSDFMLAINGAAGLLDYGPYKLADIAAENPSVPASIPLSDVVSNIFGDPAAIDHKRNLINSWIRYYLFTEYCECVAIEPHPCDFAFSVAGITQTGGTATDTLIVANSGGGMTRVRGTFRAHRDSGTSGNYGWIVYTYDNTGGVPPYHAHNVGDGTFLYDTDYAFDFALSNAEKSFEQSCYVRGDSASHLTMAISGYYTRDCSDNYAPTAAPALPSVSGVAVLTASCTTIADLCGRLTQLENRISGIAALQHAQMIHGTPYHYQLGTVHAGLTGHGTLDVSGVLGVKVATTGLPSGYRQVGSTPGTVYSLGYVTFGTSDGWGETVRIDHASKLLPSPSPFVTKVAYDLAAGVTATITELDPEV